MSTNKLWKKHFGDRWKVDLKHPNMEAFFNDLSKEIEAESRNTDNKKITPENGKKQPENIKKQYRNE